MPVAVGESKDGSFDLPPEASEYEIDGSVQALYAPSKDDPDKTYRIKFVLEVAASLYKANSVKLKVHDNGWKLLVSSNYSSNILSENLLRLKEFGHHSSDSMAVTKWSESVKEVKANFPNQLPYHESEYQLLAQCRTSPSDIKSSVVKMTHSNSSLKATGKDFEYFLVVELKSTA